MTSTKFSGKPVQLKGDFPQKGEGVKDFKAVKQDLSETSLDDYKGKRKILNIFPSIDTDVCATSVRTFNQKASKLENAIVICLSHDLPFAQKRFCGAEGIENIVTASLFRNCDFAVDYGVRIEEGPLVGLTARAVIVLDENNAVVHSELVEDITHEPDYDDALLSL